MVIHRSLRTRGNPDLRFDVPVQRFHAYKRQLLNVMHIVYEYLSLIEDQHLPSVPRIYVFVGTAAPGALGGIGKFSCDRTVLTYARDLWTRSRVDSQ